MYKTIIFQFSQLPTQHSLGQSLDLAPELAKAQYPVASNFIKNNWFPFAADN
jgi:hypothetical protein